MALAGGCARGGDRVETGRWAIVSIGPQPVAAQGWWVDSEGGRIVGGMDGCNAWRYKNEAGPVIVSDGQECPPDAKRAGYWKVITENRAFRPRSPRETTLCSGNLCMSLRREPAAT